MKLFNSPIKLAAIASLLAAMAVPTAVAQRGDRDGTRGDRSRGDTPRSNRGDRGQRTRGDRPRDNRGDRGQRPRGERPRGEIPRGHRGDRGQRPRGDTPRGHVPIGYRGNRGQNVRGNQPRSDRGQRHRPRNNRDHRPRVHNGHRPRNFHHKPRRYNNNTRYNRYGHYRPKTYSYYHHRPRYYAPRYHAPRYNYRPRYRVGGHYIYGNNSRIIYDYHSIGLYDPPYGYHWVHDHDRGDAILASVATGAIIGLVIGALSY